MTKVRSTTNYDGEALAGPGGKSASFSRAHSFACAALYAGKGAAEIRAFFDNEFYAGRPVNPGWEALNIALVRGDEESTRLLVAYGAKPDAAELGALRNIYPFRYAGFVKTLRRCGLRKLPVPDRNPADGVKSVVDGDFVDHRVGMLPPEWRHVLKTVQKEAPEALIAGGALRDLFNGRPVNDVDIFLLSRGSGRENRKFLKGVFKGAGLEVAAQDLKAERFDNIWSLKTHEIDVREKFSGPRDASIGRSSGYGTQEQCMESWKVVAGPGKTEYNILFLTAGSAYHTLNSTVFAVRFRAEALLKSFDTGLCQIACDGREIVTTAQYRDDVANRCISLVRGNTGSAEHLARIVAKYPDWTLEGQVQAYNTPPAAPQPGDRMPDGTVFAGVSPDTGRPLCAMPRDGSVRMDFNAAAKYAEKLNREKAFGHDDWRVPTKDELNVLFENRNKGALKDTFNLTGLYPAYWSSTSYNSNYVWAQRPSDGYQHFYLRLNEFSVRCVR